MKPFFIIGVAAVCMVAVSDLCADTVTIDPGNGVVTNVTQRITGATDVVVNSGTTGGGIVTLNPYNTYTGTTTLNSGTLVVKDGDTSDGFSSIGATGPLILGAGTLRYAGPDGGIFGAVITNVFASGATTATVLDIQNDLYVTNSFVQKGGAFIKTGPGTIHFSGERNNFGGTQGTAGCSFAQTSSRLTFNDNGDAPTNGLRGAFIVAEGKMVIEDGYNVFGNNSCYNSVGTWTVDEGTEKSAVVEIRGGTNVFEKCIWPGHMNGYLGTTGGENVSSGLRVTGGIVSNGTDSTESVFMGGNQSAPSGRTFDNYSFIEMTGGYMYIGKNLQMAYKKGSHSTVSISGTGELDIAPVSPLQYLGFGDSSGPSKGWLSVAGHGKLSAPFIEMRSKAGDSTWSITVADEATVRTRYIGTKSDLAAGTVNINLLGGTLSTSNATAFVRGKAGASINVLLDGGTHFNDYNGETELMSAALASVRVGTHGMTFGGYSNAQKLIMWFRQSITYTNTHPDEVRLPIDFKSPNDSHRSYYYFDENCTIDAPVRVWPSSYLQLGAGANIVGGNSLSIGNAARLRLMGGTHVVDTLSFGFTGSAGGYNTLMFASDSKLVVTNEVLHPGNATLSVYLFKSGLSGYESTPGAYDLVVAPEASFPVLSSLSCSGYNLPSGVIAGFRTVVEDGQAKLQVVLTANPSSATTGVWSNDTDDGLWKTDGNWSGGTAVNASGTLAVFSKDAAAGGETVTLVGQASVGGLQFSGANGYTITSGELLMSAANIESVAPVTNEIASTITATGPVCVNPARTGGGVMKLTGDLSGLAGGLSVVSGTLEVKDLSFVSEPGSLTIGPGTFAYTGSAAADIAGVTLASGVGTGAVLRVDTPLALRSACAAGSASLIKTGDGELALKGTGNFALSLNAPSTGWTTDGRYIGASGDGPTQGFYGITVREGRMTIGTVGDDADAPNVTGWSMVAGAQPLDGRPPAEIVMNNGTVTLSGALKVDGYVGGDATNRIVVNGGTINVGTYIGPGVAVRSAEDTLAPAVLELNGGVVSSPTRVLTRSENGNELEIFLNEGAVLKTAGLVNQSDTTLAGVFHCNGGTYKPINTGNVVYARYFRHFYLGEKGLIIDTTEGREAYGDICDLHFAPVLERDPAVPEGVSDGGIRVRGRGICYLGGVFATDGITGDFVVENGATLMVYGYTGAGHAVRILPGGALRTYQSGDRPISADSLFLGEAGNAKPVTFEISARETAATVLNHCTVSNDFAVAGPVFVGMRTSWPASTMSCTEGVYTTFVYRAVCDANVDLARFALAPDLLPYTATFAKADVRVGGEVGWKAVVMTIQQGGASAGIPRWTASTSGGNWSDAANWQNGVRPDALRPAASFAAAGATDVPVNVDGDVTIGQMTFEGSAAGRGYVLDGSGTVTFDVANEQLIDVSTGGKVTVAAPVASTGTLNVNAPQSAENRGKSGEVEFATGALDNFAGSLYPRSGTVTIPSLAWMTDPSQLWIGFGTVRYTGTGETIPGLMIRPGLSYFSSNLAVERDLTVLSADWTGNGQFMKSGDGTLYLKGSGAFAFGSDHTREYNAADVSANHLCANGDTATNAIANLSVGAGRLVIGELDDATSGPVVTAQNRAVVGLPSGGDHDSGLELNSGSLTLGKGSLFVGFYCGTNSVIHPRLTVNGGTLNIPASLYTAYSFTSSANYRDQTCSPEITVNGGTVNVDNSIYLNNGFATSAVATAAKTATRFEINGGTVNVATNFYLATKEGTSNRTPDAYVYLNGGELNVGANVNLSRCSRSKTELWLNPDGVLKFGNITTSQPGGTFCFNGGLLMPNGVRASGATATTLVNSSDITFAVSTNGAVISTANVEGGIYTVAASLVHDPALGGTVDGGLVKKGAGTLALSGTNTFTGPVVVEEGVLQTLSDGALPTVTEVRYGAVLDLGGAIRTVGGIAGDGAVRNGTLVIAGQLAAGNCIPFLDCNLATTKGAVIDFGRTEGNPVPYGTKMAVAQISGSAVGTLRFKARNAGCDCALDVTVEDGFVYVTTKGNGTKIIFR